MKHLKLFEQDWVGPPPEWDKETDDDKSAYDAINTFEYMATEPISSMNIDVAAYSYSDIKFVEDFIKQYLGKDYFIYMPLDSTTTQNKYMPKMFVFREMIENSNDMKYTEDAKDLNEIESWEWFEIKGVDYTITGRVDNVNYHLYGTAFSWDDYNFLAVLPIEILKDEILSKYAFENQNDLDLLKKFFSE